MIASGFASLLLGVVPAQDGMPVIPPPSQRRGQGRADTMEDLVGQGYEVKAMAPAGAANGRWLIVLQRAREVRTCLLRIDPRGEDTPARRTACF